MNPRSFVNLLLISCSVFFAGISLSLLSPFYPTKALSKGVSVTQSGTVIGSVFITTIIFTPFVGRYIDSLGARMFLIIGCFITGVGNISFGFLDDVNNTNTFFILSIGIRVFTAIFGHIYFILTVGWVGPANSFLSNYVMFANNDAIPLCLECDLGQIDRL